MPSKESLKRAYSVIRALGIDPLLWRNPGRLPSFVYDLLRWKRGGGTVDSLYVCIEDRDKPAGNVPKHYFHQDIYVARKIYEKNPARHVDIGSRIDGFIAHLACFRDVELWDFRKIDLGDSRIKAFQRDLTLIGKEYSESIESLSCLHVIEHIGLGRYGDTIDPSGHRKAFKNLVDVLTPGGTLYVSVPVSTSPRIEYNAHRVFGTTEIINWDDRVSLQNFSLIDDNNTIHPSVKPVWHEEIYYGCGIYEFRKESKH